MYYMALRLARDSQSELSAVRFKVAVHWNRAAWPLLPKKLLHCKSTVPVQMDAEKVHHKKDRRHHATRCL